jgi:hypothetical protein
VSSPITTKTWKCASITPPQRWTSIAEQVTGPPEAATIRQRVDRRVVVARAASATTANTSVVGQHPTLRHRRAQARDAPPERRAAPRRGGREGRAHDAVIGPTRAD